MRVYELARMLDRSCADTVELVRAQGHWVSSHLSTLPKPVTDGIFERHPPVNAASRPPVALSMPAGGGDPTLRRVLTMPATVPRPMPIRRRPGPRPVTYRQYLDDDDYRSVRFGRRLSTRDVASRLGVHASTVRQWVRRGYIKSIGTDGASHVFDTSEVLEAFDKIEERRRPNSSQRNPFRPVINVPGGLRDRLVTVAAAAKIVGVSESTIRSWIHRGHLKWHSSSRGRQKWLVVGEAIEAASLR